MCTYVPLLTNHRGFICLYGMDLLLYVCEPQMSPSVSIMELLPTYGSYIHLKWIKSYPCMKINSDNFSLGSCGKNSTSSIKQE